MKQFGFSVRIIIPHMRPLQNEHSSTKACNDADSRPTLRTGVHRMYLAAPLDAQALAKVANWAITVFNLILWVFYTGMQWKCLPVPTDTQGKPCHPLHDHLQSLCQMDR